MPWNAANEPHWQAIADRYGLEPGPINLENGYFGRMSRAVQAQYLEHVGFINRSNAVHVRQRFEQGENVEIRRQLAELIDVAPQSVAFTRNATEALQSLIRNDNRLQPGDQVLISDCIAGSRRSRSSGAISRRWRTACSRTTTCSPPLEWVRRLAPVSG